MDKKKPDLAERAAGGIGAVMQSTMYINPVWDSMTHEEEELILREWTVIIKQHPNRSVDHIIKDIIQRPILAEAWAKLGKQGQTRRRYVFEQCLENFMSNPEFI